VQHGRPLPPLQTSSLFFLFNPHALGGGCFWGTPERTLDGSRGRIVVKSHPVSDFCMLKDMSQKRIASPALESYVDESIRKSAEAGYHPTTFIGMRNRHQTLEAMEKLVKSGELQSGFRRLKQLGLAAEWSVEAIILKFPDEFTRDAVECARWRLEQI
jgi:hypothetical protein